MATYWRNFDPYPDQVSHGRCRTSISAGHVTKAYTEVSIAVLIRPDNPGLAGMVCGPIGSARKSQLLAVKVSAARSTIRRPRAAPVYNR
ncbi:MAG TPA: hypothetical protein VEH75_05855, partial [Xanthobacteraceae bacterium]|nr:hypothetical protein [Xanthobacteraceae bacterium]